jgi:ankyrin repeat protein
LKNAYDLLLCVPFAFHAESLLSLKHSTGSSHSIWIIFRGEGHGRKARDNSDGEYSLMNAVWESAIKDGDVQIVLDLLGRGADVNALDRYGQTALMLAAHAGHRRLVEVLIAHGANLNVTAKFGLSALMLAVIAGDVDVACQLAKAGADLSLLGAGASGFAGKTAYDLAVERGIQELYAELNPKT